MTYEYNTEIDNIPKYGEIVESKVPDFKYFLHRVVNDKPKNDENAK